MTFEKPNAAQKEDVAVERVNWNEIMRNSFLFSQGNISIQTDILEWVTTTLKERGVNPPEFKDGMSRVYAAELAGKGQHVPSGGDSSPELAAFTVDQKFHEKEYARTTENLLPRLTKRLLARDVEMLSKRRTLVDADARDVHGIFFVDYGLLQKGTPPWNWESVPPIYKEMWEKVVTQARADAKDARIIRGLCSNYLANHPHLPESEKRVIQSFSEQ